MLILFSFVYADSVALKDGERCIYYWECESGYCNNGFCCKEGDCCPYVGKEDFCTNTFEGKRICGYGHICRSYDEGYILFDGKVITNLLHDLYIYLNGFVPNAITLILIVGGFVMVGGIVIGFFIIMFRLLLR